MELILLAFFCIIALLLLLDRRDPNTPPADYAPTSPDASAGARVQAVEYWDEDGDPPTTDERVHAYLAQCTASRPCVATSTRYDVDSRATSRRERREARILPRDEGIPVDWFTHRQRERERVRR